jgi:hypothetical protein
MACAEMASYFLANNDAADSRGDHSRLLAVHLGVKRAKFFRKFPADLRGNRCILKQECALKELTAMQTGAEDEVAVEQSSGLFEESENVGHGTRCLG